MGTGDDVVGRDGDRRSEKKEKEDQASVERIK
jgi:hypothetical protein